MPISGRGAVDVGHVYVFRDGGGGWDYETTDLTLDDDWHELDLSSIVTDNNALLIHIKIYLRHTSVGGWLALREKGQTGSIDYTFTYTQVANVGFNTAEWVGCDTSQVIEYMGLTGLSLIKILIRGWLKPV